MNANRLAWIIPLVALPAGLIFQWQHLDPHYLWMAGAVPALLALCYSTYTALLKKRAGVDLLALISIAVALLLAQELTACVIALMFASGQALESYAEGKASREMAGLLNRVPTVAQVFREANWVQVGLESVQVGERLLVRQGEAIPVDATLISSQATLDEASLTGESLPVNFTAGSVLRSGAINVGAPIELVALAIARESTYAGIVRMVQDARDAKGPSARLADTYALWFVPLSLGLAGVAWLVSADPLRALAVLVVATPCPLLLAVPIAMVAGLSNCARRGVLVKGGAVLEKLAQAQAIFFDKTGTLTSGRARLVSMECASGFAQPEILRLAASLDQLSCHVMAMSVVSAAQERGLSLTLPLQVHEQAGAGMSGRVDGRLVQIGNADFISQHAGSGSWAQAHLRRIAQEGAAAVYVAVDGELAGILEFADQIRLETPRALRMLRRAGIERIAMLSGDHRDVAQAIGAGIGVDDVYAELTPALKLAAVQTSSKSMVTIMVGDGINDAPALAMADVGIAMGVAGAAAASESAGVVLLVDRLDRIAEVIRIARRVRMIARQSAVAGMGLSLLAMVAAAAGWLPPLQGAVMQELIDVAVILNALRALRFTVAASGNTLLSKQFAALRAEEHRDLQPLLDQLGTLAVRLTVLSYEQARTELIQLEQQLTEKLLQHERADESQIYPDLEKAIGGEDSMAAMSRSHREIFEMCRKLSTLIHDLPAKAGEAEKFLLIQRLLFSLDAILRLHFAQEDELFHSFEVS